MISTEPIPDQVARFVDDYVESIEQLEILRVLGEAPTKEWNAADLATATQIHPSAIAPHLAALEQRGLLKIEKREGIAFCRYGTASADTEKKLTELLQFYKERPVTLIRVVYDRANDRVKAFAESFRLRKEG